MQLLEKELKEGEDVQIWELSILMDAASYDAAGTGILGKWIRFPFIL